MKFVRVAKRVGSGIMFVLVVIMLIACVIALGKTLQDATRWLFGNASPALWFNEAYGSPVFWFWNGIGWTVAASIFGFICYIVGRIAEKFPWWPLSGEERPK